jgi:hypothetical protein
MLASKASVVVLFRIVSLCFLQDEESPMHRPSAQEFLRTLIETLPDLPPELARRLEELVKQDGVDRSQAIRQLFEEFAGE